MTTTVFDPAAEAAVGSADPCGPAPAPCRIGLLGLGTIGSSFARLSRDATSHLGARGLLPVISVALVRSAGRPRAAGDAVGVVTDDIERFFAEPVDVVVEVLGGAEPARSFVHRALDKGIPVVTANKSLIAAHGEELSHLARRRATALRFEASCVAGVPFLGTFERRPLVSRPHRVTAILNGTSNYVLTAMTRGGTFASALDFAQRLGYAEPDPSMDLSGADAAEKLAILIRLFGRLLVSPARIPLAGIETVDAEDIAAAAAFGGAIRPVARASWNGTALRCHVGPAFLPGSHPLARVGGVTNGIVIESALGPLCFIGPGAGPEATACTLMDDVAEIVAERRVRPPAFTDARQAVPDGVPDSGWLLRAAGRTASPDLADLLAAYGIWCTQLTRRGDRAYAITCPAGHARVTAALEALRSATGADAAAFPALDEEDAC